MLKNNRPALADMEPYTMQGSLQCLFTLFAAVLFIAAICFGTSPQCQLASLGLALSGGLAVVAVAIMGREK
jgi:hypothetical protein